MKLVPPLMLATACLLVASPSQGADTSPAGDKNDAPRLILQGRRYLEFGKTNEAEAQWLAALKLDPANSYARQYLAAIGRTNIPTEKPEPPAAPTRIHTSEGRQKIYAKLDTIRFDSVAYDSLPLSAVIKAIDKDTISRDPEQKGVNFLLSSTADPQPAPAPAIDPLTGLPVPVPAPENEVESTSITISPPQRDITLHQLLEILVLVADRPIKYSVLDSGVLITRRGEEPLYTRWYKVDPNTFLNGLQGVVNQRFGSSSQQTGTANGSAQAAGVSIVPAAIGQNPGPGPRTTQRQAQGEIDYAENQTSQDAAIARINSNLFLLGVDLTKPPKSAVYNDRLGMLMIRSTQADLERMNQIIHQCNSMPGIEGTISTPPNSAPPRIPH